MAKKGGASQLQVEINTEEDWEKLLQREGLIVVDVFSEWCGPCSGMSANLKKIKLEIGGDNLHLAMAKSDNIEALKRFRDKSEPTWMFINNKKMVNLMFGPNAPKLQRLIIEELKHLQMVQEGAAPRHVQSITELSSEEQTRQDAIDAVRLVAEKIETEAKEKAKYEREVETCENILAQFPRHGVVVGLPNCRDILLNVLQDMWEPNNLSLQKHEKIKLSEEDIEKLRYFSHEHLNDEIAEMVVDKQCLALVIEMSEEFAGDPIDHILQFAFGAMRQPPGSKDCLLMKIKATIEQQKQEAEAAKKALEAMEHDAEKEAAEEAEKESGSEKSDASAIVLEGLELESTKKADEPVKEEEQIVFDTDWYIWVPHDKYASANAMRILFPRLTEHYIVAEPPPIPDHIAVCYDAFKRKEIMQLIEENPDDVMRYGFFTGEDPSTAKFIAKTIPKFESKAATTQYGEKMVVQLSKKRSDALLAFAQLGPTYMSPNVVDGKRECKLFFPDGYDDLEEEEEVVEVKKKPKKKKKGPSATAVESEEGAEGDAPVVEEVNQETVSGLEAAPGAVGEEHEAEQEAEHEQEVTHVNEEEMAGEHAIDKATSPEAEPPSDVETEPASEPPTTEGGNTTEAEA